MRKSSEAFDLTSTFVHLGLGSVAFELPGFQWTPEYLEEYAKRVEIDGEEGRLVAVTPHREDWTSWERHPGGDELVVVLAGRVTVVQELDDSLHKIEVGVGQAIITPRGVWHTADVQAPGVALYVTPGLGTQHRPRD